jgi:4-amino-4-deoxy-L-arabinose transferase-like glycosyltransferase
MNRALLYNQLIRQMIDYACPVWRYAARAHVQKLQVLQSKCLRLVTCSPWYLSNRQIHKYVSVPLFVDHIRALTASFDSRLANVGKPYQRQVGRYLRWSRLGPSARHISQERRGQ